MNKPTLIATAALAAAALAPAAAQAGTVGGYLAQNPSALPSAADAQFRVPAGKVEHRVTIVTVSGTKALASNERQELWLSATRSRMVVKNAVTGKVRVEIVDRPGETRIYDARAQPRDDHAHQVEDARLHVGRLRVRALPRLRRSRAS